MKRTSEEEFAQIAAGKVRDERLCEILRDIPKSGSPPTRINVLGYLPHPNALEDVNLGGAAIEGLDFRECPVSFSSLRNASARGSRFYQAVKTDFSDADLGASIFFSADASHAIFRNAVLVNANFHGANLQGANFVDADLEFADFTDACVEGAVFSAFRYYSMPCIGVNTLGVKWYWNGYSHYKTEALAAFNSYQEFKDFYIRNSSANEPNEQTEPEQTEPEQTEPEQTEPEQTEPEQTEPEQTEPEQTEPEPKELKRTKKMTKKKTTEMLKDSVIHGGKVAAADEASELVLGMAAEFADVDFRELSERNREFAKIIASLALHYAATTTDVIPQGENVATACGLVIEAASRDLIQPQIAKMRPSLEALAKLGAKTGTEDE